ncbi:MAG: sulfatase-like hydrolase/transferase [Gammaproteobacteria bacterium]|nr:sulfatase-like hydrolase/transferase [Gammaproteobacteria bacterium]
MRRILLCLLPLLALIESGQGLTRPNVIFIFTDDISAREIPCYGATVWSTGDGENTSDPKYRAQTPMMDRLAKEGVWINTAWSATTCMPSRGMLMTGRYAHRTKWWENRDFGQVETPEGKRTWYLFESSPITIGQVAQMGGYASVWAGKTQMQCHGEDFQKFEFSEGVLTTGYEAGPGEMPNSFKTRVDQVDGERILINLDTGKPAPGFPLARRTNAFRPLVSLMNERGFKRGYEWWPNTPESKDSFGLNTYGPDVETDYCLDFIERQHDEGIPFFVYHATHLGHGAFDWFHPDSGNKWPGTPVIKWDGKKYHRTEPNVTGENGVYETRGTVTEPGLHSHINYIDYMLWRYVEKIKELGIDDNTVIIFSADNGSHKYGKTHVIQQRGIHVPLIIYAPGMQKQGEQDILVSLTDILPTLADIMGVKLPADYEIDGRSLWPFLMTQQSKHHDWIYSFRSDKQMIRGTHVLLDGNGKWWDVKELPEDHTSFPEITDWNQVSEVHRQQRVELEALLPQFDLYATEYDAPN